jgi:hypothetical protein
MPARRHKSSQATFHWVDPARVLEASDKHPRGKVIYEAPDLASLRAPVGLLAERACWSCGKELDERSVVRKGPGLSTCAGCGARLPFAE